jgi:zinc/manganese transport system substrate-binding protein
MSTMQTNRIQRWMLPVLLVGALFVAWRPPVAHAEKSVVTTLPSFASIVEAIGGDHVKVEALCHGYEDPHYIQPKPSYARKLRKAMLLVYDGLELEVGWLPPLLETARNPNIAPGARGLLEASEAVQNILEVPTGEVNRAQGDIHPYGNPHYMLDPRNALAVTDLIAQRLADLDPDHAQAYLDGAAAYRKRLQAKIDEWDEAAAPLKGTTVVAYHKQWEYLADWLGLDIVDYIEARPGIPPAPRHVTQIIEDMKKQGVKLVIAATFMDEDAAASVAEHGGARLLVLPAEVGGVKGTDTYIDLMDHIVQQLLGD